MNIAPRIQPQTLPLFASYERPLQSLKEAALRPFPMPEGWQEGEILLQRDTDLSIYHDPDRQARGLPPPLTLYVGVSDPAWNGWPTLAGSHVCVSPIYGKRPGKKVESVVALNPAAKVIVDSGAFSDACLFLEQEQLIGKRLAYLSRMRLSLEEALDRQYRHICKYGYARQIEAISSYDVLIDEFCKFDAATGTWIRTKKRWSEQEALFAIEETVRAAKFLDAHRNGLSCIQNVQGVTPQQYLSCAERVLRYVRPGDMVGLGSWCITGRYPAVVMPLFRATMTLLIPFLAREGITRIHLWGVCFAEALGELLFLCDQHRITLSTDSARPSLRPVYGDWGYSGWRDSEYAKKRPPLHFPRELRGLLGGPDPAEDEVLRMHYLLTHDEEFAEEFLGDEQIAWLADSEAVDIYWQSVLAFAREQAPEIYSRVKAFDGSWVHTIRAQGAHRIEHAYQVRCWLAQLHRTHWYHAPPPPE